jgi:hypothetical protein
MPSERLLAAAQEIAKAWPLHIEFGAVTPSCMWCSTGSSTAEALSSNPEDEALHDKDCPWRILREELRTSV